MVTVLVVDDSRVVREYLAHRLSSDSEIQVIGLATDGEDALEFLQHKRPDVVTMDIHMPRMNGFEATRRIMETTPVPIVILSASWSPDGVEKSFQALQAGAVAALEKPPGPSHPEHARLVSELVQTVKLMAAVPVVRRRNRPGQATRSGPARQPPARKIRLVAMGASTGGPAALQSILMALPTGLPVPVLIVQHIAAGFLRGMGDWLEKTTGWPTHVPCDGEFPLPGHAYLAPDGVHMGISRAGLITLNTSPPDGGLRPSVSHLFRSVAESAGAQAVGILLTGMGKDGAEALKLMQVAGAVTIAQDQETSVVHGMPGEAIKLGAATYVLTPIEIAETLGRLVRSQPDAPASSQHQSSQPR